MKNKKLGGYFTIEAAFLMPVFICVIALLCYLGYICATGYYFFMMYIRPDYGAV